jgi:hypothetical protein
MCLPVAGRNASWRVGVHGPSILVYCLAMAPVSPASISARNGQTHMQDTGVTALVLRAMATERITATPSSRWCVDGQAQSPNPTGPLNITMRLPMHPPPYQVQPHTAAGPLAFRYSAPHLTPSKMRQKLIMCFEASVLQPHQARTCTHHTCHTSEHQ